MLMLLVFLVARSFCWFGVSGLWANANLGCDSCGSKWFLVLIALYVLGSLAKEFLAEACPMKDCIIPDFTPHPWTLNACFQVLVRFWIFVWRSDTGL